MVSPTGEISDSPISASSFPVQESSDFLLFHESLGSLGSLLDGSLICPIKLQTSTTQHFVIAGHVSQVPEQSEMFRSENKVFPGLVGQESGSGIGDVLSFLSFGRSS